MSRPSSGSSNSAIALRVNAYTHISQVIAPSSEVGPEPVRVPVTGYSVIAEVACIGKDVLTVLGFRADVLRRTPFEPSGVMLHVSPDLEPPHLEILLDENPPVIHAALKADGQPARPSPPFPVTLHPGEQAKFFLAPVTQSPDLTVWSLYIRWTLGGAQQETNYGSFQITGDTGYKVYSLGGSEPQPAPVNMVDAAHWNLQFSKNS